MAAIGLVEVCCIVKGVILGSVDKDVGNLSWIFEAVNQACIGLRIFKMKLKVCFLPEMVGVECRIILQLSLSSMDLQGPLKGNVRPVGPYSYFVALIISLYCTKVRLLHRVPRNKRNLDTLTK